MEEKRDLSNLLETIRHQRRDLERQMVEGSASSRTTTELLDKLEQLRLRIEQTQMK